MTTYEGPTFYTEGELIEHYSECQKRIIKIRTKADLLNVPNGLLSDTRDHIKDLITGAKATIIKLDRELSATIAEAFTAHESDNMFKRIYQAEQVYHNIHNYLCGCVSGLKAKGYLESTPDDVNLTSPELFPHESTPESEYHSADEQIMDVER